MQRRKKTDPRYIGDVVLSSEEKQLMNRLHTWYGVTWKHGVVLVMFRRHRRLTHWELEILIDSDHGSTWRTRVTEMADLGFLRDTGLTKWLGGEERKIYEWVTDDPPRLRARENVGFFA